MQVTVFSAHACGPPFRSAAAAPRTNRPGYRGLEVYEHEELLLFPAPFRDPAANPEPDKLPAHPCVLITGHQEFTAQEAWTNLATTTTDNLDARSQGVPGCGTRRSRWHLRLNAVVGAIKHAA